MKFVKMSAAGNDFILFDNRCGELSGKEHGFFRQICERRRGVGADGVILLETSSVAHFKYRHFNADGSLAEMCGNGARSVSYYAFSRGLVRAQHTFEIHGVINEAWVSGDEVKLGMPAPSEIQLSTGAVTEPNLEEAGFMVLGVPHLVIFVDRAADVDVTALGRKYLEHPLFKNKTNVDFVQTFDSNSIHVRTFERGVEEEPFSCGTGAASSAIFSHIIRGLAPPITVETKGGVLEIDWEDFRHIVYLSGPVKIVYEGKLIPAKGSF